MAPARSPQPVAQRSLGGSRVCPGPFQRPAEQELGAVSLLLLGLRGLCSLRPKVTFSGVIVSALGNSWEPWGGTR